MGTTPKRRTPRSASSFTIQCAVDSELQDLLERFWGQKEMRLSDPWTKDKWVCEERFMRTFRRISDGKFVVRLSFETSSEFEETRPVAMRIFASIAHYFVKDSAFSEAYRELDLRHMSPFTVFYRITGSFRLIVSLPSCRSFQWFEHQRHRRPKRR